MKVVYLVVHDDTGPGGVGSTYVRGAYSTQERAEVHCTDKRPKGVPTWAESDHDKWCCTVHEREIDAT